MKNSIIIATAIITMFLAGCASNDKVKEDVKEVKEDLKELKEDVKKLTKDASEAEVQREDAMEGGEIDQ